MSLIVITGLAAEARIATTDTAMIVGAGRTNRVAADLDAAIAGGAKRLLSFGVAGGLSPHLQPGDLVVAHGVRDGGRNLSCDPAWREGMSRRLQWSPWRPRHDRSTLQTDERPPAAVFRFFGGGGWRPLLDVTHRAPLADIAAAEAPVADIAKKAALFEDSGAIAVDMESAIVARAARRHNLPFAILRVIADPAGRSLPNAALSAMRADGEVNIGAVLGGLLRNPRELSSLARLAVDARKAFAALARARAALGPDFASLEVEDLRPRRRPAPNADFLPALDEMEGCEASLYA